MYYSNINDRLTLSSDSSQSFPRMKSRRLVAWQGNALSLIEDDY